MHKFILGFLVFIGVYFAVHFFLAWWTLRHFTALPSRLVTLIFLLAAASLPLCMFVLRRHPGTAVSLGCLAAYVWLGVMFIWFSLALGETAVLPLRATRLGGWLVLGCVLVLSVYAAFHAAQSPTVRRIEIPVKNLPPELDGFSIVQISDTHLGIGVPVSRLERIAEIISGLKPDLIVFTGDILDAGFSDGGKLEAVLSAMSAKYGKIAVFGNHEFYHGLDFSRRIYEKCGIPLLRQRTLQLKNGIQIAGVDDVHAAGLSDADFDGVLAKLNPAEPSILLSHEPVKFEAAARRGVNLMLSGHTHAGQIWPFTWFVRLRYPRVYGLFRDGDFFLYITSGAGYWGPPMRLGSDSEIPLFVLRSKSN